VSNETTITYNNLGRILSTVGGGLGRPSTDDPLSAPLTRKGMMVDSSDDWIFTNPSTLTRYIQYRSVELGIYPMPVTSNFRSLLKCRRARGWPVSGRVNHLGVYVTSHLTQPSIHAGNVNRLPAFVAGVRRGAFTCVGWQVRLCDPKWQVMSHSSEVCIHKELSFNLRNNLSFCGLVCHVVVESNSDDCLSVKPSSKSYLDDSAWWYIGLWPLLSGRRHDDAAAALSPAPQW